MQVGLKIIANPWLTLLTGLVAIAAAYYGNKVLRKWVQHYRNQRQQSEVGLAKQKARSDNTAQNAESDRLKEIDGR